MGLLRMIRGLGSVDAPYEDKNKACLVKLSLRPRFFTSRKRQETLHSWAVAYLYYGGPMPQGLSIVKGLLWLTLLKYCSKVKYSRAKWFSFSYYDERFISNSLFQASLDDADSVLKHD